MVSMLLSFLVLLTSAHAVELPECERYRPGKSTMVGRPTPRKTPEDGFQYIQDCARNSGWVRVEASEQAKNFLKGMSRQSGQQLPAYSCIRSQESQDFILCNNKCAPRFGTVECSGRIAANKSEHTVGTAVDFKVTTNLPPNSPNNVLIPEIKKYCRLLDQNRRQNAGGRGGLTIYGIGPDSIAFMHYDTKPDWCNWGLHCENEIGEGHCKRKKFEEKEARLESGLLAARELRARADIKRLEAELRRLRADCPPGDLRCRDSYKD